MNLKERNIDNIKLFKKKIFDSNYNKIIKILSTISLKLIILLLKYIFFFIINIYLYLNVV